MEKSSKRGKIPQHDWPSIIERYEKGETLASIARTYDCSPPAISYIVSRTRARNAAAEAAAAKPTEPAAAEPQLIKSPISATPGGSIPAREAAHAGADAGENRASPATSGSSEVEGQAQTWLPDRSGSSFDGASRTAPELRASAQGGRTPQSFNRGPRDSQVGAGNGTPPSRVAVAPAPTVPDGDAKRRLHLPLPGNGHTFGPEPLTPRPSNPPNIGSGADSRAGPGPQSSHPGAAQAARPSGREAAPFGAPSPLGAAHGAAIMLGESHRSKEAGAFIDHALRERIDGDIAAFLAAFDAALDHDTVESRTGLREATDRLLRAGARTRIELERLEARVPLSPREKSPASSSLFRPR